MLHEEGFELDRQKPWNRGSHKRDVSIPARMEGQRNPRTPKETYREGEGTSHRIGERSGVNELYNIIFHVITSFFLFFVCTREKPARFESTFSVRYISPSETSLKNTLCCCFLLGEMFGKGKTGEG